MIWPHRKRLHHRNQVLYNINNDQYTLKVEMGENLNQKTERIEDIINCKQTCGFQKNKELTQQNNIEWEDNIIKLLSQY